MQDATLRHSAFRPKGLKAVLPTGLWNAQTANRFSVNHQLCWCEPIRRCR